MDTILQILSCWNMRSLYSISISVCLSVSIIGNHDLYAFIISTFSFCFVLFLTSIGLPTAENHRLDLAAEDNALSRNPMISRSRQFGGSPSTNRSQRSHILCSAPGIHFDMSVVEVEVGELISCRFTHLPFLLSNSGFEMLVTLGLPVSYTPAAPSVWPDKLLKMLLFLQYHSAPWSSSILYGLSIGDLRRSSFFLTNFRGRFKWMVKPHITSWDDLHSGFSSKVSVEGIIF